MANITWHEITTYPEMNENIKQYLEMKGDNVSLYALKRIDELEKSLTEVKQIIDNG